MRKYQPIWEALKTIKSLNECRITAHPALHKRIVKAVIKEKDMDTGYKFLLGEQGKRARLTYNSSNSILTFTLTVRTSLSLLGESNL